LAFYNCPEAALICKDFLKSLRAAVAAKAACDLDKTPLTDDVLPQDLTLIPNVTKVIVGKAVNKRAFVKLQLCEWHAVKAIKQRLVAAGRSRKDQREKIIDLIWA
jgi:hypothetical protein